MFKKQQSCQEMWKIPSGGKSSSLFLKEKKAFLCFFLLCEFMSTQRHFGSPEHKRWQVIWLTVVLQFYGMSCSVSAVLWSSRCVFVTTTGSAQGVLRVPAAWFTNSPLHRRSRCPFLSHTLILKINAAVFCFFIFTSEFISKRQKVCIRIVF